MISSFTTGRRSFAPFLLLTLCTMAFFGSCKKDKDDKNQPHAYSAEVVDKWMTLQLRLMRNATGIPNQGFSRPFAYAGVAALESLRPALPGHKKWSDAWNGLTGLPSFHPFTRYYYPANVNAALASINKTMFPNASETDKTAIDSLEAALYASFANAQPQTVLESSVVFGKAVATAVFNWADSDGYKNANAPYSAPEGSGLWKPTPPALAAASTPYWGNIRPVVYGSTANTRPPVPLPYSTDPASPFYAMVKQLYDASQTLTDDQKAMALFWRDVPGATSPGHWLSILQQVMRQTGAPLDKAALAYAFTGIAINDALIGCFEYKYQYNLVRPVTYIREVMGYNSWNSFLGTPAHPEYPSAHAVLSAAAAATLENLFGHIGAFTDHTYDYLGFAPRTYNSFAAISGEAALSRFYAGIHFKPTLDLSLLQGKKAAATLSGRF